MVDIAAFHVKSAILQDEPTLKHRPKKQPNKAQTVEFEIDHIDPLGQGVSRKDGKVTFVACTLPGETGTAVVYRRAKGVQFAHLQCLDQTADNRVEPECLHFNQCPGCQFVFLYARYPGRLERRIDVGYRYFDVASSGSGHRPRATHAQRAGRYAVWSFCGSQTQNAQSDH